jgi:hypothetical protein
MKLRKRFWGMLGTLALAAGRLQAGDAHADDRSMSVPSKAISQNQHVANDIASAIAQEVPDRGYSVNVQVSGGVAKLRGSVSSPAQMHRILQAARSRPGLSQVVNEMQVGGASVQTVAYQQEQDVVVPDPAAEMPVPQPGQVLVPASPEFTYPLGAAPQYDAPFLPPFAWPARAPYPNYSAVQYPKYYSSGQWPYIGPFHPYPEPPLDWREVRLTTLVGLKPVPGPQDPPPDWQCIKLRWEDGHWYLSFRYPWWSKRGCFSTLGTCQPEDMPVGCGPSRFGFRANFHNTWCTHKFIN